MMYRKLNLLNHLKALKMFYFSGQGDVLEQFVSQLFHNDSECTLKDNSLFFISNCFENALKQTMQSSMSSGTDDLQDFFLASSSSQTVYMSGSPSSYFHNLEFAYIKVEDQISKKKIGEGGNHQLRAPVLLMNLHNIEDHVMLRYKRKSPLDLVITDQAIAKYNRIFFTLLKLKKILQLLKECWKELNQKDFKNLRS